MIFFLPGINANTLSSLSEQAVALEGVEVDREYELLVVAVVQVKHQLYKTFFLAVNCCLMFTYLWDDI